MKRVIDRTWQLVGALCLLAVVCVATWTISSAFVKRSAPYVIHSATFTTETVAQNGLLALEIDVTRHEYCPGLIAQFWVSEDGTQWAQGGVEPIRAFKKLGRRTDTVVKIAPFVHPGRWCYAPQITLWCDHGPVFISPDRICLNIVESL